MAVTRLEVHSIRPFAGGAVFGDTGPYRQIDGIVHLAVDPNHPANEVITDIKLAPRDAAGRVHCSADFTILQPEDPSRGSHRIVFDVVNRGNPTILTNLNSAGQRLGAGNGFLMRHGYTVAWCGWQYDVPPSTPGLVKAYVPEALNADGSPISGRIAIGFQPYTVNYTHTLADRAHKPHPAADINEADATLVVREYQDGPAEIIPRDQWSFARLDGEEVVADSRSVYLAAGFQPGKVYEINYTTTGADVVGMGMLAPRDLVSFLRYGSAEAGNPCAGDIEHAFTFGRSQSGGFLRRFLYCGLTQDEEDRPVFEGLIPLVAGSGRGEMNQRFGQPSTPGSPLGGAQLPLPRHPADGPGLGTHRWSAGPPGRCRQDAQGPADQHLGRVLERPCLPDPHHHGRERRPGTLGERAHLPLFRHPARPGPAEPVRRGRAGGPQGTAAGQLG